MSNALALLARVRRTAPTNTQDARNGPRTRREGRADHGAGSGIGLATAAAFASEGARVVAAHRATDALSGLDDVEPVAADLLPDGAVESIVTGVLDRHGAVNVLVDEVGLAPFRGGFFSTTLDDWRTLFDLNFFVAVRAARAVLPTMVATAPVHWCTSRAMPPASRIRSSSTAR